MADLYVALLHHPVYDKTGAVVTTAVTNLDVHDIARLSRTFDVRAFYVCTPVETLRRLVARIIRHWDVGPGATYNATRREALALVRQAPDLDAAMAEKHLLDLEERHVDAAGLHHLLDAPAEI